MKISDLKNNDKPRERLINEGIDALSNMELLALIIGSGGKNDNVFDIATNILKKYRISDLRNLTYLELIKIPGIKKAKACILLASFELAKRSLLIEDNNICLESSKLIYNYIKSYFYLATTEKLVILFLSCKLKPIGVKVYSNSTADCVTIPLKSIIKQAIDYQSYGVVIAHNHPSNDLKPSIADFEATKELKDVLSKIDIILFDHLIVGDHKYYSFNDNGLINDIFEYALIGDDIEERY